MQAVAVRCDDLPNSTIDGYYAAVRDFVADTVGLPAGWVTDDIATEREHYDGKFFYVCAPTFPAADYADLDFTDPDGILASSRDDLIGPVCGQDPTFLIFFCKRACVLCHYMIQ